MPIHFSERITHKWLGSLNLTHKCPGASSWLISAQRPRAFVPNGLLKSVQSNQQICKIMYVYLYWMLACTIESSPGN